MQQTIAQKSIGELTSQFQKTCDSVLISYLGEAYVQAHFKINFPLSFIKGDNEHFQMQKYDSEILVGPPMWVRLSYDFYPDQKYCSYFFCMMINENNAIKLDTMSLILLKQCTHLTFITDSQIEKLAKRKLHLTPGEFEFSIFSGYGF